jgi:hypothetical protein
MLVLLLFVALTACASEPTVELRGERFRVEIARSAEEQARGLMFRDHMDADAGMLFVYDTMATRTFWMRNCRIPLDILYFDDQARLVGEALGVPPCNTAQCPTYDGGGAPAQYVLELNAGVARKLGVQRGDVLRLPE